MDLAARPVGGLSNGLVCRARHDRDSIGSNRAEGRPGRT
jgi:hypothetical protein